MSARSFMRDVRDAIARQGKYAPEAMRRGHERRDRFTPAKLRQLADTLEQQQRDEPRAFPWNVDVVAPERVWERYDEEWSS